MVKKNESLEVSVSEDQAQFDLARRTVAKDATDDEFKLFVYDCKRRGVHPLDKLIHFTKRQGRYTPVTSIDFFRSQAEGSGDYAGNDDPIYDDEANPRKATVTVYKMVQGQRVAFSATARWDQYYPGDAQGFMWKKMPHLMLGKCAEALALRKAFPRALAGLYTNEEMDQAGPASVSREEASAPKPAPLLTTAQLAETPELATGEIPVKPEELTPPQDGVAKTRNFKFMEAMSKQKKRLGPAVYYRELGGAGFEHCDQITDRKTQEAVYRSLVSLLSPDEDENDNLGSALG